MAGIDLRSSTSQSGAYQPLVVAAETFTYNTDGTVATETVSGVTFTYAYNADLTVHTVTRSDSGTVFTYTYNSDGTIASVA